MEAPYLKCQAKREMKDAKALTVKDGWRAMSGPKQLVDTTSATNSHMREQWKNKEIFSR